VRIGVIKGYMIKELKEIFREKVIVFIYLVPSMIILLFGYGIKLDVTNARIGVIDYDNSPLSFELRGNLEHSKYFRVETLGWDEVEALRLIKKSDKDLVLIIPENFEKNAMSGKKAEMGVFIDGSFPSRTKTIEGYIQSEILDFASKKQNLKPLISVEKRNLFNRAMRDEEMIVPGLIAIVLLISPAIISALSIVKEKERGTIFNFYSSGVKKEEFLLSKLIPLLGLQSLNIFLIFFWATVVFDVPFRGDFLFYFACCFVYLIISLSIGILVSLVTSAQIVALLLTLIITIIPGFLYSGMLMPVSSMESGAYITAHIYPTMYQTRLMYDAFLVGDGFSSWANVEYFLILTGYSVLLSLLGYYLLKKRLG